jgi:hypothetical protein
MNIIPVGFLKGFAQFKLISIIFDTLAGAVIKRRGEHCISLRS